MSAFGVADSVALTVCVSESPSDRACARLPMSAALVTLLVTAACEPGVNKTGTPPVRSIIQRWRALQRSTFLSRALNATRGKEVQKD